MEDWYNVTVKDIYKNGGTFILSVFNGSTSKGVMSSYPEHNWMPWRFRIISRFCWRDNKNHRLFFDWISTSLNHTDKTDWYGVNREYVYQNGGQTLLTLYYQRSLFKALEAVYPDHKWIEECFVKW